MDEKIPTADEIKQAMLERAKSYCASADKKMSLSRLGLLIVKDSKFFTDIDSGERSFNIKTYGRVMDWFDAEERVA